MPDSEIYLKSICSLLTDKDGNPATYWIPGYQRGYRWSPLQVTQLLDDIWEFSQNLDSGGFYCLQPLVVKARSDGSFEVVDGQQRLTTIYIILTYLKPQTESLDLKRFRLTFETRGEANEPFLAQIDLSKENDNVDFYHICQAYKAVEKWFSNRPGPQKMRLLQHLLNDDESGRNTKVIWFQLSEVDIAVNAFTRLNVGKIPLTNEELIRALFLKRTHIGKLGSRSLQHLIAHEWDLLEKTLQSDAFWYFLNDQIPPSGNRIGYLFDLVVKLAGIVPDIKGDAFSIFYTYSQWLEKDGSNAESEWLRVKETFMTVEEWFNDRTLYHIVGYLLATKDSVVEIAKLSEQTRKAEFVEKLLERIYVRLFGAVPSFENLAAIQQAITAAMVKIDYLTNRQKIKPLLLLFNIATLLDNEESNIRFQFDSFKGEKWDIEHIRSSTLDKPKGPQNRNEWLANIADFLDHRELPDGTNDLKTRITDYLSLADENSTDELFDQLYFNALEYFGEDPEDEPDHSIANLVLLDSGTNRSYKNSVFAVKRKRVIELDKKGIFVPLCTRNVFLKCYSTRVSDTIFWSENDRDDYSRAIADTLASLFSPLIALQQNE